MMFNASLNVLGVDVEQPEGQNHLIVTMDVGLALPFQQPGSNQPVMVPSAQVSFPITKEAALKFGGKISEAAEKLKSDSGIEVATDLSEVEKAAQALEGITHGQRN